MAPSPGRSVGPRDHQVSASKHSTYSRLPTKPSALSPPDSRPSSHAHLQLNLKERPYATYHPAHNAALSKARAGQVDTKETAKFVGSTIANTTASSRTAKPQVKDDTPNGYPDFGVVAITPTPSLVSASSMSTQESPKTNILRRKPSVIGTYTSRHNWKEDKSHHGTDALQHTAIAVQPDVPTSGTNYELVNYYERPEFSLFPKLHATMQDMSTFPPPTPLSDPSSFTPSLRYTESPGTFSQVTTPTTRTSYSPLIAASPLNGGRALTSPSKYSAIYDQSRPSSSRAYTQSPDESFGHPFFRETAIRSTSPRKKVPESGTSGEAAPSFRQRSKLTKVRPVDKVPASSNSKALKSVEKIHPPELAHLSEQTSPTQHTDQLPPSRPSRDGTPSLASGQTHFPVVYSNLSSLRSASQRRPNSASQRDSEKTAESPLKQSLDETCTVGEDARLQPPKSSSKVSLASSGSSTSTPNALREKTPPTKPASRFGFLSRKNKTIESHAEPPKVQRKGPAAGTGHEGYGKHAAKPRSGRIGTASGSTTTSGKIGNANPSTIEQKRNSASQSDSDIDEFLTQRLKPIYMRGDGTKTSDMLKNSIDDGRTDSRQSTIEDDFQISPSLDSPKTSQTSRSSMDPSNFPRPYTSPTSASGSRNIGGKLDSLVDKSPNLLSLPPRSAIPKSSAPGWSSETSLESIRPSTNQKSKLPFAPRHRSISSSEESPTRPEPLKPEEVPRRKKTNWLPFMRSTHRSKTGTEQNLSGSMDVSPVKTSPPNNLPVHVTRQSISKPVAHYALIDDSKEHVPGLEDIQNYLEEAKFESDDNWSSDLGTMKGGFYHAKTTQTTPSDSDIESKDPQKSVTSRSRGVSNKPRSAEAASSKTPGIAPKKPQNDRESTIQQLAAVPSRPSRLPQVGRIPKVVSTRVPERTPPERSFSRPFAATQLPSQQKDSETRNLSIIEESDALTDESGRDDRNEEAIMVDCSDQLETPASDLAAQTIPPLKLFTFTSRKGSTTSYSSSSAASFFPAAVATAVVPGPGSPLSEDEIWTEYDDLLDDVVSPISALSASTATARGAPSLQQAFSTERKQAALHSQDILAKDFGAVKMTTASEKGKEKDCGTVLVPYKSGLSLTDRGSPSSHNSRRVTLTGSERTSTSTGHSSLSSNKQSEPLKHKRSSSLNQILELSKTETRSSEHIRTPIQRVIDPQYMANLRFGALMTSKWLSFGRVLFSPIQLELKGPEMERVLVIDGLGKDWSYYCALTYPDTSIFCLGPSPSSSQNRQSLGGWQSLPNHRHFSHTDWNSNFPFPKGFFAAVVFRFPSAMSDVSLRSTLCECKRVLRPGGYIEVSALDLDLNNMGNIARKAVRELKIKMQRATPNISVKPMSDQIQTLLGRRGFENLNRCIVGIPAAGIISDSREASIDENQKTLTELVHDSSQEGDESITKMVSRVGRWWYARCYEMSVLPNGDLTESVWNDKMLLRECERLSTTFKLLICYAQKPSVTKRRTVSL